MDRREWIKASSVGFIEEAAARRFPITDDPPFDMRWGNDHRRDGAVIRPWHRENFVQDFT